MSRRAPALLLVALSASLACKWGSRSQAPPVAATAPPASVERHAVDTGELHGLSDLARADGRYLAIAERQRALVPLALDDGAPRMAGAAIPLDGVPEGEETEALAWLGGARFAIGTETQEEGRASD